MHQIIRERNHLLLEMAAAPGFRLTAWLVFEQLTRWENAVKGYTQPSQGVIARAIRRSRKAVNEAVAWLRKHGFIKTQQRYVLHRDRTLYGTLRYWIAKELGQVEWLLKKRAAELRDKLLSGKSRVAYPAAPKAQKAESRADRDARERYWLEQLGCNPDVAEPSSSVLNSDNLMSPAVKKPPGGGM